MFEHKNDFICRL